MQDDPITPIGSGVLMNILMNDERVSTFKMIKDTCNLGKNKPKMIDEDEEQNKKSSSKLISKEDKINKARCYIYLMISSIQILNLFIVSINFIIYTMIFLILVSKLRGKKPFIKIKLELLNMYSLILVLFYGFKVIAITISTLGLCNLTNPTYLHLIWPNYLNVFFVLMGGTDFIVMDLINHSRKLKQ